MDPSLSKLLESHFGPESDLINVEDTIQQIADAQKASTFELEERWTRIPEDRKSQLKSECSIWDLKATLEETWADPTLSSFLLKDHDRVAAALSLGWNKDGKATRRGQLSAPDTLPAEVRALHESINNIKLSSWTFSTGTSAFVRTPRNADQNAYDTLKSSEPSRAKSITDENEAIVIVSFFNKIPWSPCYVARLSQHAFLSSQSLEEMCKAIPCSPYAGPAPPSSQTSRSYQIEDDPGCLVCIEELAYGEEEEGNYAAKLMVHLSKLSKSKAPIRNAPSSLRNTRLATLSIRINEPYWVLHRGNCEHFVVVDQIRAVHRSDPRSGYPITLHHIPELLDICRACAKSPAVWSIVNDIRLGESPSFLCAHCWSNMGMPEGLESNLIEVIPLLSYIP